jgi:ABC-type multidrug transport system ATPase subunit
VGLDPEERVRFRNLLSEVAHGRVVILSTHIVSDVEAVATRIAILRGGRLVSVAAPEDLMRSAAGRVFTALVPSADVPRVQAALPVSGLARRAEGVHVRYVGRQDALTGARPAEPTLEDAYLLATLDGKRAA